MTVDQLLQHEWLIDAESCQEAFKKEYMEWKNRPVQEVSLAELTKGDGDGDGDGDGIN